MRWFYGSAVKIEQSRNGARTSVMDASVWNKPWVLSGQGSQEAGHSHAG